MYRGAAVFLATLCLSAAASAPEQIHVAFAGHDVDGNSNAMTVSWATPNATATSTVMYGFSPDVLTLTVTGFSITYLPVLFIAYARCWSI